MLETTHSFCLLPLLLQTLLLQLLTWLQLSLHMKWLQWLALLLLRLLQLILLPKLRPRCSLPLFY
mgnify:FL=1